MEKFPRKIREEIPLLAEGSHVLWITGHRISEAYKVDEDTRTILQVEREMKRRN
jgi:tRNA(Ile)-lysidine synthase